MKIGIITFHRAHNCGAVLQCYALQKTLIDLGHNVKIIDFAPPEVFGYYDYHIFTKPLSIKSVAGKVIRYFSNKKRSDVFENYLNTHLNLTERIDSFDKLKEKNFNFDAVICGSDQVWNLNIVGSVMGAYYLDFLDDNIGKIAYSASYEQIQPSLNQKDKIKEYLQSFKAISLREDKGIQFTSKLWGKEAIKTLDPCMLLKKQDYSKISNPIDTPNKYLLVYMLGKDKKMAQCVRYAADELNLQVVNLGRKINSLPIGSMYFPSIGPNEFIYLVNNAQCVCTNSFHGSCFSILYKKPFVTFGLKGKSTRLKNLIKTFGIHNHMVWSSNERYDKVLECLKLTYQVPDSKLENERNKSLEFLKRALK